MAMFERRFCPYCGQPLSEGCRCGIDAAQYEAELIEELENRPETLEGWRQQDLIDLYRRER